MTLSRYFT